MTGLSTDAFKMVSIYALTAGYLLFLYKVYIAYLTLRRTSSSADTPEILRAAICTALILALPYGVGAWLVDTVHERSRVRATITTVYVTLTLIGGYIMYFTMQVSNKLDFSIPSF